MTKPTLDERRNGWDERSLQAYLEEREQAQSKVIQQPPQRLRESNHKYNPKRWRD